ncbi:hypothetical protein Zmor_015493 [Zophobas morio]|uniref:Uncharacterized protein n=1 Tax=Zophobas morio TaxID=2755281 RepID=A0AA38IE94_9CUCU|nr:hypothetical protein Zmor_015493 [Zophobas morio]
MRSHLPTRNLMFVYARTFAYTNVCARFENTESSKPFGNWPLAHAELIRTSSRIDPLRAALCYGPLRRFDIITRAALFYGPLAASISSPGLHCFTVPCAASTSSPGLHCFTVPCAASTTSSPGSHRPGALCYIHRRRHHLRRPESQEPPPSLTRIAATSRTHTLLLIFIVIIINKPLSYHNMHFCFINITVEESTKVEYRLNLLFNSDSPHRFVRFWDGQIHPENRKHSAWFVLVETRLN